MKHFAALLLATAFVSNVALADDFTSSVTKRVSEKTIDSFAESNGDSVNLRMSKNGRFIVFESQATNLVPDPFNGIDIDTGATNRRRIYLYDRQADSLELVSLTYDQEEVPADCFSPSVSDDGRFVAFTTDADVSEMVNVCDGEFCHISVAHDGTHVYVRDRVANDTMLITQVTLKVQRQARDSNGVYKTYEDNSGNDRPQMETLTRRVAARIVYNCTATPPYDGSACVAPTLITDENFKDSESANPRISGNGQYIVYDTDANNLVWKPEVFVAPVSGTDPWDYNAATGIMVNPDFLFEPTGYYGETERYLGPDGNPGNHTKVRDVYVRDGKDYSNKMISLTCKFHEPGTQCAPDNDGVVQALQDAVDPSISSDGQFIAFSTKTPFLSLDFNGTDDVFVISRSALSGEITGLERVSNNTSRIISGNGASTKPSISGDGRYVVFESAASDLVTSDSNGQTDIFLHDRNFFRTILCSQLGNGQLNAASRNADITASGEYISFESASTNAGSTSGATQVYVAQVTRAGDGGVTSCSIQLGSQGTGTGLNQSAVRSGVAVVPQTSASGARTLRSAIAYESIATNATSEVTDANGKIDIFQAPICSEADRSTDTDGDGTSDCFDQCYKDRVKVTDVDTDSDGFADCEDGCKSDAQKSGPGACGCGVVDVDTDADGKFDCVDECPTDPAKAAPGTCGCGIADTDANGNGVADCNDTSVPPTATPSGPTATPTPGGTGSFTGLTPATPSLSARGRGRLFLSFSTTNVPSGILVTNARACFKINGRTRCRNTVGGLLKGFRRGQRVSAQVTLQAVVGGATIKTKASRFSKTVTVR